jgi:hypothetical protein
MNCVLYQIYEPKDESKEDQFFNTIVMGERELREYLTKQIKAGKIAKELLEKAEITETTDIDDVDIDIVFGVFVNSKDYGGAEYFIEQFEMHLDDIDCYD